MKVFKYVFILLSFTLSLASCKDSEPAEPIDPIVNPTDSEEVNVFTLNWKTSLNPDKQITNLASGKICGDYFLYPGDSGDPPILMAFNKDSGEKVWEYEHDGSVGSNFDLGTIYQDMYIGMTSLGIIAIDLNTQLSVWEIDLQALNFTRGYQFIHFNNKIYMSNVSNNGTPSQRYQLMEIDPFTGAYELKLYSDEGIATSSPPVFFEDSTTGEVSIIINEYPDNSLVPEQTTQNIKRIDLETGEILWQTDDFTDFFSSNVLHPPIVYQDVVITGGDWSMYGFDIETGTELWRTEIDPFETGPWVKTNHLIYENRLYVNNSWFNISCLNPLTGAIIWSNDEDAPNCSNNMVYYESKDYLVFSSWGWGSVIILDALTGELVHREQGQNMSPFQNDVSYDSGRDMFFSTTYLHAYGFTID